MKSDTSRKGQLFSFITYVGNSQSRRAVSLKSFFERSPIEDVRTPGHLYSSHRSNVWASYFWSFRDSSQRFEVRVEESFSVAEGGKAHTPDRFLGSWGSWQNLNRIWQEPSDSGSWEHGEQDSSISVYCPRRERMLSILGIWLPSWGPPKAVSLTGTWTRPVEMVEQVCVWDENVLIFSACSLPCFSLHACGDTISLPGGILMGSK